ncbi:MAG TPA: extracellular solute-binding protein, partial [Candidatus Binatia bacterium]|nr:extracellular solute-binding protein [Candidatus Binatia bacterium]
RKRHLGRAGVIPALARRREPEASRSEKTCMRACAGKTLMLTLAFLLFYSSAFAAESPNWKEEWQRVIEGAKKEGQLSLYGGLEITHPDIIAAFTKEFPFIKITSASGRAADMVTRIVAERRADKYLADVTASGPNGPRTLYLGKMLDPIGPALILPEVNDRSKWYGGQHWYADPENKYIFMFEGTIVSTGISYNTKLVRADEIKSYWDMLDPKWKGKLLGQDPRGAALLTPVLILYHRPGIGPEFVRRLYTETDITLFRDRRQGTNWLATGKFPLCHLCREIDKAVQQGLPVDEIPPEKLKEGGTIGGGGSSVIALVNRAPHPNAAKVFINWYLSGEGQSVWQKVMNVKEVEASDSMRIDIPKDDVLPDGRRAAAREYQVIGFLDPEPVQKLLNEILK